MPGLRICNIRTWFGSLEVALGALCLVCTRGIWFNAFIIWSISASGGEAFERELLAANMVQTVVAFLLLYQSTHGKFIDRRRDAGIDKLICLEMVLCACEAAWVSQAAVTGRADLGPGFDPAEAHLSQVLTLCVWVVAVNTFAVAHSLVSNRDHQSWTAHDYENGFRCMFCCMNRQKFANQFEILGIFSADFFGDVDVSISDLVPGLALLASEQRMRLAEDASEPSTVPPSAAAALPGAADAEAATQRLERELDEAAQLIPYALAVYGEVMFAYVHGEAALAKLRFKPLNTDRDGVVSVAECKQMSGTVRCGETATRSSVRASATARTPYYIVTQDVAEENVYVVTGTELAINRSIELSAAAAAMPGGNSGALSGMGPIIFLNLRNEPGAHIPYGVFLDPATRSVVVAFRGTISLHDAMTDLLAVGMLDGDAGGVGEFDLAATGEEFGFDGYDQVAHFGFIAIAINAVGEIKDLGVLSLALFGADAPPSASRCAAAERTKHVAEAVRRAKISLGLDGDANLATADEPWGVRIVGHSLGAGVAALAGLLLRSSEPALSSDDTRGLHCYAYSCPLATISPRLAKDMEPFTTSVVLGNDIVPRASVRNFERARDKLLSLIAQSKRSPALVMACVLLNVLVLRSDAATEVRLELIKVFTCCSPPLPVCFAVHNVNNVSLAFARYSNSKWFDAFLCQGVDPRANLKTIAESGAPDEPLKDGEKMLANFIHRTRKLVVSESIVGGLRAGTRAGGTAHAAMATPGRVIFLEMTQKARVGCGCCGELCKTDSASGLAFASHASRRLVHSQARFRARWGAESGEFQEIKLKATMLDDHFLFKVGVALRSAAGARKESVLI